MYTTGKHLNKMTLDEKIQVEKGANYYFIYTTSKRMQTKIQKQRTGA